jgi:hypothetical protein
MINLTSMVTVPRSDDVRIRLGKIGHLWLVITGVELPVRPPDLREVTTLVGVHLKLIHCDIVYHTLR